jgi:hypothetical protein
VTCASVRSLQLALFLAAAGTARAGLEDRIAHQVRLGAGGPEWASLSYEYHYHHGSPRLFRDPFLQAEMGVGAGRLSVGSGWLESAAGGRGCVGEALKLTLLRTMENPLYGEPLDYYAGIEVERFVALPGRPLLRLGFFYPVSGPHEDRQPMVSAGLAFPIFSSPRRPSFFGH